MKHDKQERLFNAQMRVWQTRLRLQDWGVSLHVCRLSEMPSPDCIGSIAVYEERKEASMSILSPQDLPLLEGKHLVVEDFNYAVTIVHELLHLHFAPFQESDETPKGIAQEQAINCISAALVSAYTPQKAISP
jgi:hypothetical protein